MSTENAPATATETTKDTQGGGNPTALYGVALPEDLLMIGVDVDPKPGQLVDPRLRYPVSEFLARDLDLNGQETDLLVYKDGKSKKLFVEDGRQRNRAARFVNQWRAAGVAPSGKTEPMTLRYRLVTKGTSMRERWGSSFAANVHIEDTAAVKAEKMALFLKEHGTDDREADIEYLCTRTGITRRRFDELMNLRENAPAALFEAAKAGPDAPGGMGTEAAIAAVDLPPERQVQIINTLKQEKAQAAEAKAQGKIPQPPTPAAKKARSADALREEAKVAKAAKKGETKYPRPSSSEKKDWLADIKFHNNLRKKKGEGRIMVDAAHFFEWLNGDRKSPLITVYKELGLPLDADSE